MRDILRKIAAVGLLSLLIAGAVYSCVSSRDAEGKIDMYSRSGPGDADSANERESGERSVRRMVVKTRVFTAHVPEDWNIRALSPLVSSADFVFEGAVPGRDGIYIRGYDPARGEEQFGGDKTARHAYVIYEDAGYAIDVSLGGDWEEALVREIADSITLNEPEESVFLYESPMGESRKNAIDNFNENELIYTYIDDSGTMTPEEVAARFVDWIFSDMSAPAGGKSFHITGYENVNIRLYSQENEDEIPPSDDIFYKGRLSENQWVLFMGANVSFEGVLASADGEELHGWVKSGNEIYIELLRDALIDRIDNTYTLRTVVNVPSFYR